jgi:YggT family protein
MFILGNLLSALAYILNMVLQVYWVILIARVLISWVNPDPYNAIVRFLYAATDPLLFRIRRVLPLNFGGVDFSPIVVIIAIAFLQRFLVQTLLDLSVQLR